MIFDTKNENQNNENNISKSLSKIVPNESNEDKNQLSISESNDLFNYPSPKKMLSEMSQLSKRMRKEEYDNQFSNRTKIEELRTKYIPSIKGFMNNSIIKKLSNKIHNKDKINIRLTNMNINKISLNKNKIIDKKILKPNINAESINNTEKPEHIDDKKYIVFNLSSKNLFFSELLKENCDFTDNIKQISKTELLKIKNDKEKIIILIEKNREILNVLTKVEEQYKLLRNEYIDLYKNINNYSANKNYLINSKNEYENYIRNENNNLNKKIENYENIFISMTNYINDISKLFYLKQISFAEIRENVNYSNKESDEKKNNFIDILNENIRAIDLIIKDRFKYKNNLKSNTKIHVKRKNK